MIRNPWRTPVRTLGQRRAVSSLKYDSEWMKAIREVVEDEKAKFKRNISVPTVIQDLSSRNGTYFAELRKKVNTRYIQLKREKKHEQDSESDRRDQHPSG